MVRHFPSDLAVTPLGLWLIAVLAWAAPARADGPLLALDAGIVKMLDGGPTGVSAQLYAGWGVGPWRPEVGAGIHYGTYQKDADSAVGPPPPGEPFVPATETRRITVSVLPILAGAAYRFGGASAAPYLSFHAGLARVRMAVKGTPTDLVLWDAAFDMVVGLDYRAGMGLGVGFHVGLMVVTTKGESQRGDSSNHLKMLTLGVNGRYGAG